MSVMCAGSCLWFVYAETHKHLKVHLQHHHPTTIAAISGGVAGGVQAMLAAPAENVRTILEGGTTHGEWRNIWREVFKGAETDGIKTKEAREAQAWLHEFQGMVRRGW